MKKYIRLVSALFFLPFVFAACNDDDGLNTGDATVQFETASETITETTTQLDIPIVVEGTHDGLIKVTVQYKESNGLKDDENVIITSRDLVIPAGTDKVYVETKLSVYDEAESQGRALTFEITKVEGATLGTNSTYTANLQEATDVYDKLAGSWTFVATDIQGKTESFPVTLKANSDRTGFDCVGFLGENYPWKMSYAQTGVSIQLGDILVSGNFGDPIGEGVCMFASSQGNNLIVNGSITGTWNTAADKITFNNPLIGAIFDMTGNYTRYVMFQYASFYLSKVDK